MKYLFILALLAGTGCSTPKSNYIIEEKNCGNLHCVVFVQEGDTFALDFLTDAEFDSLKQILDDFEQRKGNAGSVER
jgi:hypothetical protein